MDMKDIHICFDRVLPLEHKTEAAEAAIDENERNHPRHVFKGLEMPPGVTITPLKMALFTAKLWKPGRTLRCAFLDGTGGQHDKTIANAREWCDYANIVLDFSGSSSAEIRISYEADPGSWSAIGTDCLVSSYFKPDEPTMNFGWLRDGTPDEEWRRVVVHEFGHALGAIHEHQNPNHNPIKWNKPAVYQLFMGPPNNWTKEDIDHNIFEKYAMDQLNSTVFDPLSIMLYGFPASLTLDGHGTQNNTDLSDQDKAFIAKWYPKS